jgi:D-alanine-D-alanine ligase
MSRHPAPRTIPAALKRTLRILFVAKHARWDGGLHPEDGTHATYHREMRQVLEAMGLNLMLADDYRVLFDEPLVDFVFPLLNRGGFLNSEMLLPLLCERLGLPYLGATPILRGLADDKHLAKRAAVARGVPTAPWTIFRRGAPVEAALCPAAKRYVVKPNASSASWGVSDAHDWAGVRSAVIGLHDEGHDAIVEPFIDGHDIEVSVITIDGEPLVLPTQIVEQADPALLRTYQEKRNLCDGQAYEIRPLADRAVLGVVEARAREMMREFMPFDYGRFEFRIDVATGEIQFLEVNLNCNLWSRKTIAMAAAQIGWSHAELIETILAESLRRQGLVERKIDVAAA